MDKRHYIIFTIGLLLLSLLFEYYSIINLPPQSAHTWRQSDCASITLNYVENGLKFNEPRVFNTLLNGGGYCVAECPIIYYTIACIWTFTGQQHWIFRSFQLLIFFGGLFSLFSMTYRFTQNVFLSYFLPFLLFSSPYIMIYASGFLPDVPSLSFILIGLNLLFKYVKEQKIYLLIFATISFIVAGLLKANAIISIIALMGILILDASGVVFKTDKKYFPRFSKIFFAFIFVFIVQYFWYSWAIKYNKAHQPSYFTTGTWPGWPLWEASSKDINYAILNFKMYVSEFWHFSAWLLILTSLLFIIRDFFKRNIFAWLVIIMICGFSFFFLYFFVGFSDNSYYFVNMLILPVIILLTVFINYPLFFNRRTTQIVLSLILIANIVNAKLKFHFFYHNGWRHEKLDNTFYEKGFTEFIDNNIEKDALVISIPDFTPNESLYLIKRHGISVFNFANYKINENDIRKYSNNGYKYLIVVGAERQQDSIVKIFSQTPKASFKNVRIFTLHQ